jgi:CDP-diacylglycerol pyrophosphatase
MHANPGPAIPPPSTCFPPRLGSKRLWTILAVTLACLVSTMPVRAALNRSVLWRVVQACNVSSAVTGAAFPCLKVDRSGYVVLRAPMEATHIVVLPTRRTIGVEDVGLQGNGGPNLFAAAWDARHYVMEAAPRPLEWDDIGLAVNSQPGRTQDQLHIHVDCVRPSVRDALFAQAASINATGWTNLRHPLAGGHYEATLIPGDTLAPFNIFHLAAQALKLAPQDLNLMTIAVLGVSFKDGRHGFYVLAGRHVPGARFPGSAENLLDHACRP